jgi:hypothetical protein
MDDKLSFLGKHCSSDFRVRTVMLQPGDAVDYNVLDWADTVMIVERGVLGIECCTGTRASFPEGAVLSFAGVTLRRLRNAGTTPLVLSALSRSGGRSAAWR